MKPTRIRLSCLLLTTLVLPPLLLLGACKSKSIATREYMFVSAPETSLRDKVATMYGKVGTVHNGERVEVLDKQKRFLQVRTDSGQEGWIEQRSLVSQEVYDGFAKLAADYKDTPVQAHGTTRAELNMHLTPARDGEHLYQLKEGEKLEILKRTTTDKNAPKPAPPPKPAPALSGKPGEQKPATNSSTGSSPANSAPNPSAASTGTATQAATKSQASAPASAPGGAAAKPGVTPGTPANSPEPPKLAWEDWYLVRSQSGHAGWVLLRMVDLDVPLDIAQYAEGQRIIGYFVLNTVDETIDNQSKQVPQYLVLLNAPKDGLPYDFNQIRVFTRNRAKHRYETAYRQRELEGYLPAQVGHQVFDKEGDLPTFAIRSKNDGGQMVVSTYKLNGTMVRRVPTPEEEAAAKAKHDADLAARQHAAAKAGAKRATQPKPGKKSANSAHHHHKKS